MPASRKTYVFELPLMFLASKGGGTTWTYIDIPVPGLEALGAYLASMTAHANTTGRTAYAEWKVVFWWSVDGKTWNPPSAPVDLFAAIATDGQAIQTPFTDASKLGIHLRFAYAIRASQGVAVESVMAGGTLVGDVRS